MLGKNKNKTEILAMNQKLWQKCWAKKRNFFYFWRKFLFLTKICTFGKKLKFSPKIEIFPKNKNFGEK